MHQCDYCCWYVNASRGCEAPYQMRDSACRNARNKKEAAEYTLCKNKQKQQNNSIIKERGTKLIDLTCSSCNTKYKDYITKETNSAGMWIEHSICPNCKFKNITAWHVW